MLYSRMQTLDLHGIDRDYAKILVRDFIRDAITMKEEYILIIHGIGKGIIKKAVYEELKRNPVVREYKQDNFNPGCTIVRIKIN